MTDGTDRTTKGLDPNPFRGLTVDPEGAADLDDAFAVSRDADGWTVEVAVPDCRRAVFPGGAVDSGARERGETAYAGTAARLHMLGNDVAGSLSLTPGTPKAAILFGIRLDRDLSPSLPTVRAATFLSAGRLSYEEVDATLRAGAGPHASALATAAELTDLLAARRKGRKVLGLMTMGNGLATDEEGRLLAGRAGTSHRIVEELMVLVNASLATLCAAEGIPILFRNHRPSSSASREALSDALRLADEGLEPVATVLARLDLVLGRARLGPFAEGHWGLDLPAYAWFTSPIRRYADLVNQRALMAWAEGAATPDEDLAALGTRLNGIRDATMAAKSAHLKDLAARAAGRRIDAGRIATANQVDMTAMLKAVTDGAEMPGALLAEALARLEREELTSKDVARLLAMGPDVATRAVGILARLPHVATSVANHLALDGQDPTPSYSESSDGPHHALTFLAAARIVVRGEAYASPPVPARALKTARQRALVHALALAHGATPPVFAPDAPATPQQGKPPPPAPANPKGALLEFCQKRQWPMPSYEGDRTGPSHEPVFTVTATVTPPGSAPLSARGRSASRKGAEAEASGQLLRQVRASHGGR